MMTQVTRKLPSADWVAFGLAVVGLILSRFYSPFMGIFALAVFGPSVLRELGWLKDGDEFSRGIMYRAGFHTALVAVLFIYLNRILQFIPGIDEAIMTGSRLAFPLEEVRKVTVMVFLFSYLIQYWGARQAVFRIMLGMALLTVIESAAFVIRWGNPQNQSWYLPAAAVVPLLLVGVAFAVRRWPYKLGILLSALAAGAMVDFIHSAVTAPSENLFFFLSAAVQVLVFCGVAGISLIMSGREVSE